MLLAADRIHEGLFQAAASHALNTMHSFQAQSVSPPSVVVLLCRCCACYPSTCSLSEHTAPDPAPTAKATCPPVNGFYAAQWLCNLTPLATLSHLWS